ncbi:hypothetical protein Tco_0259996 [Tanacetum coccineum]
MMGNLKLLCNFVEKFLGTVRFGNDQFAPILGYGDLNQGNVTIKRVYYVEGLNHNLFSVGQFCDADLEVAFRKSTCFVRDLQGNDLLTGNRGSDLYTISLQETTSPTPICFMAKAFTNQAWKAEFASHGLVWSNASQVKFTKKEVEDHHRISSISKNNESSNSRTSNVNAVCAECGKCVFNSNHDACVSRYLNDVNARTKKPNVVPISASKPKRKMNKSVATPHKKTVASDTTIQKPKSYFKELYENTNKAWKWWIAKKCPSGYKWTRTTPPKPSLKWKPTGRIFSNVRQKWIPTGKLLNSCTGKVDSEPTHGSIAPFLNAQMTFVHISSGLVLHQMTSDHNRSELEIQVHINEQSSSKLVPKVMEILLESASNKLLVGANQHITYTYKNLTNVIDVSYLKIKVTHPNGTGAFITKIRNMPLTNYLTLYDVMVVPEYCVSLISVHKVARDSKLVIAFDEMHCYVMNQDLREGKVSGN